MTSQGQYADGRKFPLPGGWEPIEPATVELALSQAQQALGVGGATASTVERLCRYYDPAGGYSGSLFLSVEPNDDLQVTAADLWAVSTLSMEVPPLTGRALLIPGPRRTRVTELLGALGTPAITDLTSEQLETMWNLHDAFRTVMSTDDKTSNWWVFAAKMCARKRPLLFPVRDSLVCSFLSGGKPLGKGPGRLGRFDRDIQVYAYLMTSPTITDGLHDLRKHLAQTDVATEIDQADLRLLDVALWTAAQWGLTPPEAQPLSRAG